MSEGEIHAKFEKTGVSAGKRLFNVCEELGPTFIKIGQILSTRTDLISQETAKELSFLQDSVAPVTFDVVKELIESEFSDKLENIFEYSVN